MPEDYDSFDSQKKRKIWKNRIIPLDIIGLSWVLPISLTF